jgi:peptidoglycan/LPS O-acetylase OafA/YrhL
LIYLSLARPRDLPRTAARAVLFAAICWFIGWSMALYGVIWLLGALAYWVYRRGWLAGLFGRPATLAAAMLLFVLSLVVSKTHLGGDIAHDFFIGLTTTILVLVLTRFEGGGALYRKPVRFLADASYTIYLAHFPFIAMLINVVLQDRRFGNSVAGYAMFFALGAAGLIYSAAVFWLFERHTPAVRRFLLKKLTPA